MSVAVDILSWLLLVAGGFFLFVGAFGLIRLPDFWSRLHAASIIDSAGAFFVLAGLMLQGGLSLVTVKLILIGVFLLVTGPTASHAVANAAWIAGSRPRDLVEDQAAEGFEPVPLPGGEA